MTLFTRMRSAAPGRRLAELVSLEAHGLRWLARRDWAWLLEGPQAPDWSHLRAESVAELVKRNQAREVWRVEVGGQQVYAKIYRAPGWRDRLRVLLRGPGHRAEWRAADYARQRGIPAIEPIAQGSASGLFGPWMLITLAVLDGGLLNEGWQRLCERPRLARDRVSANQLIRVTARLVARAHQEGFRHQDLHAGNLMVQPAGPQSPAEPVVLFVDLQKVRVNRAVSRRAALGNLAQLNQWFRRWTSRTDRLRFLTEYLRHREVIHSTAGHARDFGGDVRSFSQAVERVWRRHAHRLWAKRDRRVRRDGRYFARVDLGGGWQGHVFLRSKHLLAGSQASQLVFARDQWKQWLAEPLNWVDPRQTKRVKESKRTTVCQGELPVAEGALPVMIKRVRPRRWKRWLTWFRHSRNLRTWRKGHALLNRDLPTARPLAVLERRRVGLRLDSLLITELPPEAVDLATALRQLASKQQPSRNWALKYALTHQLVRLVKEMHACGFYHRDLKASNVLLVPRADGGGLEPWLIDLDGLIRRPVIARRRQLQCLLRLSVSLESQSAVTRTDRLRFLLAFLRGPGRPARDWKPLWRKLEQAAARKRRRKRGHAANSGQSYGPG